METQNQIPAPMRAFGILGGMMNSFILSALIRNNVIESLGAEAKSAEELAGACNLHPGVLARTLRYSTILGVVQQADGKYALTDVGRCFLKDTPGSLYPSASFISAPPWRDSWMNFEHCLKTGGPAFDHVFGEPFFQFLDTNQEYGAPFNHYMTMMTAMIAPAAAEAYDFTAFGTICDVGGGQGLLLRAVLEKTPQAKGILFDMHSAMKDHVADSVSDRVEFVAGSFFDAIPPADCMILKTVIHDWNDADAIKILTNCRRALNPGGKVLLVEQVVEEPYMLGALFYDLHMQVMLGGAERTEAEFAALFGSAGLGLQRIIPTKSPMKILEAVAAV